jgi:hypothetical protein
MNFVVIFLVVTIEWVQRDELDSPEDFAEEFVFPFLLLDFQMLRLPCCP